MLLAWETLHTVIQRHQAAFLPMLVDCLHAVSSMADNRVSMSVCLAALQQLKVFADALAEKYAVCVPCMHACLHAWAEHLLAVRWLPGA